MRFPIDRASRSSLLLAPESYQDKPRRCRSHSSRAGDTGASSDQDVRWTEEHEYRGCPPERETQGLAEGISCPTTEQLRFPFPLRRTWSGPQAVSTTRSILASVPERSREGSRPAMLRAAVGSTRRYPNDGWGNLHPPKERRTGSA